MKPILFPPAVFVGGTYILSCSFSTHFKTMKVVFNGFKVGLHTTAACRRICVSDEQQLAVGEWNLN